MIEKVARAIWEAELAEGHCDSETTFASYMPAGRAAIAAMREPGHELTAAVVEPTKDRSEAVRIWQAMIDAALK